MSEDWLDTLPVPVIPETLPVEPAARLQLVEELWTRLTESQKKFLTAYRQCGLNGRAANRQLTGSTNTYAPHTQWMYQPAYRTIVRIWRGEAGDEALNRDRLLARQDRIVETAMTPKPVLHEGIMVLDTRPGARPGSVLEEVEVSAASRANEVLMKAAGLLKDKEVEVNVGVAIDGGPPRLDIQVMPRPPGQTAERPSVPIDAKFTEIPEEVMPSEPDTGNTRTPVATPAPDNDEWLE